MELHTYIYIYLFIYLIYSTGATVAEVGCTNAAGNDIPEPAIPDSNMLSGKNSVEDDAQEESMDLTKGLIFKYYILILHI